MYLPLPTVYNIVVELKWGFDAGGAERGVGRHVGGCIKGAQ
jgi:hypothetical protein